MLFTHHHYHFPPITPIRQASFSHFLLMFGYKLFSLYFPLFLLSQGLSLREIGLTYLLIYLPIAVVSPFVGFLNYKIKPSILITLGILGYALYSFGMLTIPVSFFFYFFQVVLGIGAALFFVSERGVLVGSHLQKPERAFAWFYAAPYYAQELAPAIGAILIFKWGFVSVFALSLIIHLMNIIFTLFFAKEEPEELKQKDGERIKESLAVFSQIAKQTIKPPLLFPVLISFSVLLVNGVYMAFFPTFLKSIGFSQNAILLYLSVFSFIFVPLTLYMIRRLAKADGRRDMLKGGLLFGGMTLLFGATANFIGSLGILVLMELGELGAFLTGADRSGILSRAFSRHPKEMAALDTVLPPLGTALGALIGGILVGSLGYGVLFAAGGVLVVVITLATLRLKTG